MKKVLANISVLLLTAGMLTSCINAPEHTSNHETTAENTTEVQETTDETTIAIIETTATETTTTKTSAIETTTEETTTAETAAPQPTMTSKEFAEKFKITKSIMGKLALSSTSYKIEKTTSSTDFFLKTHTTTGVYKDFRDLSAPFFSYLSTSKAVGQASEVYYFYLDDYFHLSLSGERTRLRMSIGEFDDSLSEDPFFSLIKKLDENAVWYDIQIHENGSVSATVSISTSTNRPHILDAIFFLTNENYHVRLQNMTTSYLTVTIGANGFLEGYIFDTTFSYQEGTALLDVQYHIESTEIDADQQPMKRPDENEKNSFVDITPSPDPEETTQQTPSVLEGEPVSASEFAEILARADAMEEESLTANIFFEGKATAHANGTSASVDLLQIIEADVRDPENPQFRIRTEIGTDMGIECADIYYTNGYLYTSMSDEKYKMAISPEELFAEEDASQSYFFFSEAMIQTAYVSKYENGAIRAEVDLEDNSHQTEVLALIESLFGDDYSSYSYVDVSHTHVHLKINKDGRYDEFNLQTVIKIYIDEIPVSTQYSISIIFDKTSDSFSVYFPNNLDTYQEMPQENFEETTDIL